DERDLSSYWFSDVTHSDLRQQNRRPRTETVDADLAANARFGAHRIGRHPMGGKDLTKRTGRVGRIPPNDLHHVDVRDAPNAAPGAHAACRSDSGHVVAIAKTNAKAFGLAAIPSAHRIGVHEAVARRERRADNLFACAVQEREALPHLGGSER